MFFGCCRVAAGMLQHCCSEAVKRRRRSESD
jgi:hypothetical protein